MESSCKNSHSVIQYYKGTDPDTQDVKISNSLNSSNSVDDDLKEVSQINVQMTSYFVYVNY